MEAHREELALLETLDTANRFATACATISSAPPAIRWYAEALDKVYMAKWPHRQQRAGDDRSRTNWRDRRGGAVKLPAAAGLLKLGPALAAGNSVILKPSEKSPPHRPAFGRAGERGRPAGRRVERGQRLWPRCRQALALHPDVEVITFTGSTRTGKEAAERRRRHRA